MTKKIVSSTADTTDHEPMQICFERIIPDELDHERPARRALREFMVASAGNLTDTLNSVTVRSDLS